MKFLSKFLMSSPSLKGRSSWSGRSMTRRLSALSVLWWVIGAGLIIAIGGLAAWGIPPWADLPDASLMVGGVLAMYSISIVATRRMARVDIGRLHPTITLASTAMVFGFLSAGLLFTRTYYSRSFLLTAMAVAAVWLLVGRYLKYRLFRPTLAVAAGAVDSEVLASRDAHWTLLSSPGLPSRQVDAVIANRESSDPDWQRFYTRCEVEGLPVYDGDAISEQVTGRVSLERLSAGHQSSLHPHSIYAPFKRLLDLSITVATMPLILLVAGLAALAIKLDSPGPLLFVQERVGQGSKRFLMVKFRSMHPKKGTSPARFANREDDRVTRVGRFIRRSRIDELPQFWNVLKGEMSLIGPRPEQVDFVEQFEASIPFFGYRHLVKPGISGWAQVHYGYVASEEHTRHKLEYDLYYAKHCSFWLDMVIIARTFRTIVTGDGAR